MNVGTAALSARRALLAHSTSGLTALQSAALTYVQLLGRADGYSLLEHDSAFASLVAQAGTAVTYDTAVSQLHPYVDVWESTLSLLDAAKAHVALVLSLRASTKALERSRWALMRGLADSLGISA
jgi:hypothetical protein